MGRQTVDMQRKRDWTAKAYYNIYNQKQKEKYVNIRNDRMVLKKKDMLWVDRRHGKKERQRV